MRLLGVILLLLLGLPGIARAAVPTADTGAYVASSNRVDSRTLDLSISSQNVEGSRRSVRLLLPPGWSQTASRTWPALYFLHGGGDDYRSWSDKTDLKAFSAGKDVIVVLPDTSWCSAYSDWWNHGNGGSPKWETFVTLEVRQILERGYRASDVRAVAGNSMGGLGALKFAENHPGMFRAAASFSGNVDPLHSYSGGSDGFDKPGLACLADWKRVWGDPAIPAQRAIWVRNDPYEQAAKLAGVRVFLSSGDGSGGGAADLIEQGVNKQSKALAGRLGSLGIPVTSHFYSPGTHGWSDWQREMHRAFPLLLSALGL